MISVLIAAALVAAILAGCGEAAPQSKAQFVTKVNEICASLVVEQRRALDELGKSYAAGSDELADAIDAYRDVIATRLERIKDLGKPDDPPRTYISSLRSYVGQLESAPSADPASGAADPQPVEQILKQERPRVVREARGYGMEDCRALDSSPLPLTEQPLGTAPAAQ